jgi:hypothetical protein
MHVLQNLSRHRKEVYVYIRGSQEMELMEKITLANFDGEYSESEYTYSISGHVLHHLVDKYRFGRQSSRYDLAFVCMAQKSLEILPMISTFSTFDDTVYPCACL